MKKLSSFTAWHTEPPQKPGIYLMYDDDIGIDSIQWMEWTGKFWQKPPSEGGSRVMVTQM
jgi:hypothetical protein